jgi:benzylsuccinate CoA-transferase BbsF subunit
MAALDYRRRTGKGQFLDMSQYEPGLQFMAPAILDYTVNKRVAGRQGNFHPYAAPHNAYKCRGEDRWCAIAVFTDDEWRSFCMVIDNPSLADDPMFSSLTARKKNENYLDLIVNGWTELRQAEQVMEMMQAAGVPAGVVENAEDQIVYDPQLKARHYFWEMETREKATEILDELPYYRLSLRVRQGPQLGEHNNYVFKDVLGISDEEISELVEEKVIA